MTSRGRASRDDAARARRAAASRRRRSCGPTESRTAPAREIARRSRRQTSRAVGRAARLVAARQLAEDDRGGAREQAGLSAAASPSDRSRYGRSPTSSRNSTWPGGGANAYGVPSEAASCVSVPPHERPAASPAAAPRGRLGASSPSGSPRQAPERTTAIVAVGAARRAGRRASAHGTTTTPRRVRQHSSSDVRSL